MISFPIAGVTSGLLGFLMASLSLFLILLVLVQRGKGGGLAGALGGPGGQSAFGSKAGDTFTWITVGVAAVWGIVCALAMLLLGTHAPSVADEPNLKAGVGDQSPTGGLVIPSDEGSDSVAELLETEVEDVAGDKPMMVDDSQASEPEAGEPEASDSDTAEPSMDAPASEDTADGDAPEDS